MMTESEKKNLDITSEFKKVSIKKKVWPVFLFYIQNSFEEPSLWLTLNMVVISSIIWPSDSIHTNDIALIFGLCYIFGAFSKLVSGILADKYSRIKLMAITSIGSSFSFLLYGFMPEGLALVTFSYIIGISILREIFTGTETVIPSFLDDAVQENKRSEIFGLMAMIGQLMYILSSLICAFLFRYIWKQYFIIVGLSGIVVGIIILIRGKEPKRGSKRNELIKLLKIEEMEYGYNLNKETIRSTIFSRTNLIIILEGMFTQIILIVPQILLIGYLESEPYNFSPIIFAFIGIIFGGPGVMIGSVIFSKKIDKSAEKSMKYRIYYILTSLVVSYLIWVIIIFIPYVELTPLEGDNFLIFISYPAHIIFGILYFFGFFLLGMFVINQRPLIQKLNLPEAQGAISSLNSFFEVFSIGVGAIIAGMILNLFNNNYQLTVLILMIIGLFGASLWLFALKTIDKDIIRISEILNQRSEEIGKNSS